MARVNRLFINNPDDCVNEMLQGIALQNPGQQLLKKNRVIIRDDIPDFCKSEKVSVISGGGSGHEPFAAGFVGQGMLAAAVAGSVFTSPPPNDILAAVKAVANPAGILLVVANYTGDRLNFGIAMERAKALKIKIEMVVVGEDCALESQDKTAGRRGLVGIMVVMKIAGALSEEGKSLEYIASVAKRAASSMGTIGVSLSGCSIPGRGSSFVLDSKEMELGLGAHGEAGVKRMELQSADDTIETMINHMINPATSSHLSIAKGEQISLIMNNLGGLSVLEMHILTRKAIQYLEQKGFPVARLYFGHFMTSLDMSGFNLNILKLDEERLTCLDASTNAPSWPGVCKSKNSGFTRSNDIYSTFEDDVSSVATKSANSKGSDDNTFVLKIITGACNALIENEERLNTLDTSAGDGDCGSTLKRGATEVLAKITGWGSLSLQDILLKLAGCAEETMGGASGGLYSLFFVAAAGTVSDLSLKSMTDSLQAGINAVSKYGGAEPGDRTMLDSLVAVLNTLLNSKDLPPSDLAKAVAEACTTAAESTVSMKAKAGRASYVANDVLTMPDAGATGVAVWVQAIAANFS